MKVVLELELSDTEVLVFRQNSIERVFHNAIWVGQRFEQQDPTERASILWQDCEELKPIVTHLWNSIRNATFTDSR